MKQIKVIIVKQIVQSVIHKEHAELKNVNGLKVQMELLELVEKLALMALKQWKNVLKERITVMLLVPDAMNQDVVEKQIVHGILQQKVVKLNVKFRIVQNVIQIQRHVMNVRLDIIQIVILVKLNVMLRIVTNVIQIQRLVKHVQLDIIQQIINVLNVMIRIASNVQILLHVIHVQLDIIQ